MKRTLVVGLLLGLFAGSTAVAQTITVTKPAANETWTKGAANPYTILWTKQGQLPPTVTIALRNTADTADVLAIASGVLNSGSYPWTPPASVTAGQYRIRVSTPGVSGTSATFSIAGAPSGPLKVTSPNGGESWALNGSKPITWTPGAATGNVKLELYRNGTAAGNKIGVIAASVAASAGTYAWTVGAYQGGTAPAGTGYRVMVVATTPALQDASDNPFTIAPQGQSGGFHPKPGQVTAPAAIKPQTGLTKAPPVKILAPDSGQTWTLGQTFMINWTADTKPDDGFTVDLLKANGTKVRTLLDGGADKRPDGSWIIWGGADCGDPPGDYRVRITSWYAQQSATSGAVHAVANTKKSIEKVAVKVQNAELVYTNCGGYNRGYNCEPWSASSTRAAVGTGGSETGSQFAWSYFRARLTFDLTPFKGKTGVVESATLIPGDAKTCLRNRSASWCVSRIVLPRDDEVATWNTFKVPQNLLPYPLVGWWNGQLTNTGGLDITQPIRDIVKGVFHNNGFVVTSEEVGGGCATQQNNGIMDESSCSYYCLSDFTPIMYVTFVETLCGGQ